MTEYTHKHHLEAWITCPRKYELMVIKKVPWEASVPMEVGERFHVFAAEFFESIDYDELRKLSLLNDVVTYFNTLIPQETPLLVKPLCDNFVRFEAERFTQLLQWYENPIPYFKPVAVEKYFEVPKLELAGTIDRIDRTSKDTLCVIEYKTGIIIRAAMRRELAFYALIVDASKEFRVPVTHIGWYNPRFNVAGSEPLSDRLLQITRRRLLQFKRSKELKFFPKRESEECIDCVVLPFCLEGGENDESSTEN